MSITNYTYTNLSYGQVVTKQKICKHFCRHPESWSLILNWQKYKINIKKLKMKCLKYLIIILNIALLFFIWSCTSSFFLFTFWIEWIRSQLKLINHMLKHSHFLHFEHHQCHSTKIQENQKLQTSPQGRCLLPHTSLG